MHQNKWADKWNKENPDIQVDVQYVAWADELTKVQAYIAAGATKFVMRPCGPFEGWREQIEILSREVIGPLQTAAERSDGIA